jgi:hypothetical protein
MNPKLHGIRPGFQLFVLEGGDEVGSIRTVGENHLDVYIENSGDFVVDALAVARVHDGKVVLDPTRLDAALKRAIAHAHDREDS